MIEGGNAARLAQDQTVMCSPVGQCGAASLPRLTGRPTRRDAAHPATPSARQCQQRDRGKRGDCATGAAAARAVQRPDLGRREHVVKDTDACDCARRLSSGTAVSSMKKRTCGPR